LYLAIGILSLCIGSFLNVVIYRTPKMMEQEWTQECQLLLHPEQAVIETEKLSLSLPASSCPHCRAPIRWYHNIPVLSWLALRGKCYACDHPITM
ncbi:prepilin peptidase, partial [Acinetobacter baumannii]